MTEVSSCNKRRKRESKHAEECLKKLPGKFQNESILFKNFQLRLLSNNSVSTYQLIYKIQALKSQDINSGGDHKSYAADIISVHALFLSSTKKVNTYFITTSLMLTSK